MAQADAELMLAFQQGDESAFTQLVERFQDRIINYVWRMVQDRHAAEDLAQETFIRLYMSADRYEPRAPLAGYLFRIATNLALNYTRDMRHRRAYSLATGSGQGGFELADSRCPAPSTEAVGRELAQLVRQAIRDLPDQQRAAVMLRRFGGLSYSRIAEALATSIPAVKSLLFRARSNLKKRLAGFIREGIQAQPPGRGGVTGV